MTVVRATGSIRGNSQEPEKRLHIRERPSSPDPARDRRVAARYWKQLWT